MSALGLRLRRAARAAWSLLRELCGDSAYETYLSRLGGRPALGRRDFYLDRLERRYRRPNRCC